MFATALTAEEKAAKLQANIKRFPKFESLSEVCLTYSGEMKYVRSELTARGYAPADPDVLGDLRIYRFLKDQSFCCVGTVTRLVAYMEWRSEAGMDAIRAQVKQTDVKTFPHSDKVRKCTCSNSFHGTDRSGQPVLLERIGFVNIEMVYELLTLDHIVEYSRWINEKLDVEQVEEAS
jgi:hypothetical protein